MKEVVTFLQPTQGLYKILLYHTFSNTQAKLSLRLEYVPPKPGKSIEGEITATDETDLGDEPDEFGGFEDEGMDEVEGGGAEGVTEAVRYRHAAI